MVVWNDVALVLVLAFAGGPFLVEITGYIWHRWAEHLGVFGDGIRVRHWRHHEVFYPVEDLRHGVKYQDAHSWTWYVMGGLMTGIILYVVPWLFAVPLILGGWAYGMVLEYCHKAFHLPQHWLHRFSWFNKVMRRHDIHHYGPYNYGILLFWMDWVFGTLRDVPPSQKMEGFPHFTKP